MAKDGVDEKMKISDALESMAEYDGMGHEDAPLASMPQLRIVSADMRGYTTEGSPIYGAKVGSIWYMGDDRIEESISVVPSYYHEQWTEYSDVKGQGMPCAVHKRKPTNAQWDEGLSVLALPNGHVLKHTGVVYGIIQAEEMPSVPFVIFLYSSQYRKFSDWTRQMGKPVFSKVRKQYIKLPAFARSYTVFSAPETDGKHNWLGWQIMPEKAILVTNAQSFTDARDLYFVTKENYNKLHAGRYTAEIAMPQDDDIPF